MYLERREIDLIGNRWLKRWGVDNSVKLAMIFFRPAVIIKSLSRWFNQKNKYLPRSLCGRGGILNWTLKVVGWVWWREACQALKESHNGGTGKRGGRAWELLSDVSVGGGTNTKVFKPLWVWLPNPLKPEVCRFFLPPKWLLLTHSLSSWSLKSPTCLPTSAPSVPCGQPSS